jgi:ketosteroid isomerase-like protein
MDPRAAAAVFTADVRLMEPNMPDVNGRDSVEAMMGKAWLAVTPRAVRFRTDELYVFANIAFEVGNYVYTFEPRGQPVVEDRGRYMGMWKKEADGAWRLHRFIENSALPIPDR